MTKKEKTELYKKSAFTFKDVSGNQVVATFLDFYTSETGEKLIKLKSKENRIYLVKEKDYGKKWRLK